ncbi:MAG: hypothetical protein M9894_31190 [Planctomycetes bacterium]|nr:hypothetical protein [Planctomycetota bacterium]
MRRTLPLRPAACLAPVALLGALLGVGLAAGQDLARWPAPPEGWWRRLEGGERAVYALTQGPRTGRRVMTVERIEGSRVTVSFEQAYGHDGSHDAPAARHAATIDLADPTDAGDLTLPEGARLTRVGREEVKVGERAFACDVYEVALEGPRGAVAMKAWHAPALPPVFMGGVVKLTSRLAGHEASIALTEYKGALLGE